MPIILCCHVFSSDILYLMRTSHFAVPVETAESSIIATDILSRYLLTQWSYCSFKRQAICATC